MLAAYTGLVLLASPVLADKVHGSKKTDSESSVSNHSPAGLDTSAIRKLYTDGDFEPAIEKLESARTNGFVKSHQDSVFVFKHLGVMYAAKYETIERGKQYMYLLLSIEPSVKIMDMYASDMIYMIFRNVQEEFEIRHARPKNPELNPDTVAGPKAPDPSNPGRPKRRTWPFWTAGGVALAAGAGVAAYFLFSKSAPEPAHYDGALK